MRSDVQYSWRENIIGLALLITIFAFMFLGILFNAHFPLFMGLGVITASIMLYFAEPRFRGVAVIPSILGTVLLLIYFFG